MIFEIYVTLFLIFAIYFIYLLINDPVTNEYYELVAERHLIRDLHNLGRLTDDEYYEKYYDYKEKMKEFQERTGMYNYKKK